jgi:hypothetical protein
MKPRREFIRSVAVAATFALARPAMGAAERVTNSGDAAKFGLPDFATFARLKGTKFRVSGAAVGDQFLELDQVLNVTGDSRLETVSLRFRGDATVRLRDHTYRFSHPECGAFDFYINPGTNEAGRCCYRAIVCRFV